ncbi:MAG: phosphoserine phosphatase SerB [Rhodospirillales bacterium]
MDFVITLIADPAGPGLAETVAGDVARALREDARTVEGPDWLDPGIACDIVFSGISPPRAEAIARTALGDSPVDAIAQSVWDRRKKLLVADMDSTIVTGETLDDLAARAGVGEAIAAITRRAMNGQLGFAEALRERVAMIEGVDAGLLEETYATLEFMPGARRLVATMRHHGAYTALVSGGFTFFTRRVKERLGFDYQEANILDEQEGRLTGRVMEPILSPDRKLQALIQIAASAGLDMAQTLAVGDGSNDIKMLAAAGLGIAYRAKPVVRDTIRTQVNHGDLTALLYAQGYRAGEIVDV